jgi:hypothetical protein
MPVTLPTAMQHNLDRELRFLSNLIVAVDRNRICTVNEKGQNESKRKLKIASFRDGKFTNTLVTKYILHL